MMLACASYADRGLKEFLMIKNVIFRFYSQYSITPSFHMGCTKLLLFKTHDFSKLWKFRDVKLPFLAVLSMLLALTSTGFAADISKLRKKAAEEGQVRVIVGLKLPAPGFKPEGTLASSEAVKQQREAIAATREALLNSLAGYEVLVYAVYDSVPYVAMKVDSEALEHLANSPYMTTIQEDSEREPHKSGADVEASEDAAGDTKNQWHRLG